MSDVQVSLRLIGEDRDYSPGEKLSGEYFVDVANPNDIRAVEISVLWYTEGKGDEDLAVHFFQRTTNDDTNTIDLRTTQHFTTTLPNTPVSYDGVLLRIRWCVRVRAFLPRGRELVAEEAFRLGDVPRARGVDQQAANPEDAEVEILDSPPTVAVASENSSAENVESQSEPASERKSESPSK